MISISLSTFVPIVLSLVVGLPIVILVKRRDKDLIGGLITGGIAGLVVLVLTMSGWKSIESKEEKDRVAAVEFEIREASQERHFAEQRERQNKERDEIEAVRTELIESLPPEWERLRLLPTQYRNGNDFPRDSFEYEERSLLIGVFLEQHGDSLPKLTLEQYGLFRADIRKLIMSYIDFEGGS